MSDHTINDASVLGCGDCLDILRDMPSDSVDLVFCSPPYEAARTYGIDFNLRGGAGLCLPINRVFP